MSGPAEFMTRREALRALGVVAGGASLAMTAVAGAEEDTGFRTSKPKERLRLDRPLTAIVMGAGTRGTIYGKYALRYPDQLNIVGVAEPLCKRKSQYAELHDIPEDNQFVTWEHVLDRPRSADAVIISMPDHLHHQPCLQALDMGYDILLEKPIAQSEEECREILAKTEETGKIVAISHVLRYAPYFVELRDIVQSGALGDVVSIQHLEPIAFGHMVHSYVRGNWHNSKESTPILLGKSCHDLDILRWIVDKPCTRIMAFGRQSFYMEEHAPEGSAARCLDCSVEQECAFSALKVYLREGYAIGRFVDGIPETKEAAREAAMNLMRTGDYGRCVFRMDNDQPEHIVTSMEFEGGITANFAMEGLCSYGGRRTRIMGTRGDIVGDMKTFTHSDFATGRKIRWKNTTEDVAEYRNSGHGGGDFLFIRDFVEAVYKQDPGVLTSTVAASVESHVMGYRAEKSRMNGTIEDVAM
jgi:predicted dehydrogenase